MLDLEVGAPAHGGFCVARSSGRVVFVRHALPGERVRARVTEDAGGSFCRADAVEILSPSPDRVTPPCPHAGPGRCGGCDWQHVAPEAQRRLKAAVVRDQFRRVAGLEVDLDAVAELPGGSLGWRTRVAFAVGSDGTVGLRRHRSHEIEPVSTCPLGTAAVRDAPAPVEGVTGLEAVAGEDGAISLVAHRPGSGRQARGRRPPDRVSVLAGPDHIRHRVGERTFRVAASGFWQVHPHALATFTAALLDAVQVQPGERVLDLYAGAGALTVALADAVGPEGQVVGIESARTAVADASANLAGVPQAEVRRGRVDPAAVAALAEFRPDVVVLDPPRAGAGVATMRAIAGLEPRSVGYVSCDPATLARDVRALLDLGWSLRRLQAFDAFPMTHHIECVAELAR